MRIRAIERLLLASFLVTPLCFGQSLSGWLGELPLAKDYTQKRVSSYDRTGANDDFRPIDPSQTLTLLDEKGPGEISHIWVTIASPEKYHLKKLVMRIYWDGESDPSVEAPIGDFFGLGNGEYFLFQSLPLAVGSVKALNCFFPMPFNQSARITVTNEGKKKVGSFYYNIDLRVYSRPFPSDTYYFHAQYRQCAPCQGWTNNWQSNGDELVDKKPNLDGEGNYVFLEATGRGHYVGVTQSIFQNQDDWWGEGDDMIFVDGEKLPSINGTGSEDYYLGAWGFDGGASHYLLFGVPVMGGYSAGARWSVYRFHLDSPIPFTKSLRVTIEHGHANHRSDNYFSVAYWYQSEPHAKFPPLPPVDARIPRLYPVGGPGNAGK
jgi:D-arabinan exo alpha-(1,3)/(1,5)-arabinofuranosidase (non-reducing end)